VVGRLWSDTPNFTPVLAAALFGGMVFRWRATAVALPITAMLISDAFIGGYSLGIMLAVYAALTLPVVCRPVLRAKCSAWRIGAASLTFSLIFFIATNAAVWAFGGMYQHTAEGLWTCFVAALPFFKYTLAGDLTWTLVLFGGYAAVRHAMHTLAARPSAAVSRAVAEPVARRIVK
jgi:hypothetical protein